MAPLKRLKKSAKSVLLELLEGFEVTYPPVLSPCGSDDVSLGPYTIGI